MILATVLASLAFATPKATEKEDVAAKTPVAEETATAEAAK